MSCMLSSPKLIASLAKTICHAANAKYDGTGLYLPESLIHALDLGGFYGGLGIPEQEKIYKKLYILNVSAYNGRYAHHQTSEEVPEMPDSTDLLPIRADYKYGHFVVEKLHFDFARTLDFFVYQCSEDANRNSELLDSLRDLCAVINSFIVKNSVEYRADEWGKI